MSETEKYKKEIQTLKRHLADLNSALNVLRHHGYADFAISYAETIHKGYHKRYNEQIKEGIISDD